MEKPGIRPGYRGRHGSLTVAARLCLVAAVLWFAPSVCPALEADVSVVPDEVEVGRPFLVRILAYPAKPADTSLEIENLPESFVSGASGKEKRITEESWAVGSERMTATLFSREWTPTESGEFSIGPLVLRAGKEELRLAPVQVRVIRRPDKSVARLFWSMQAMPQGDTAAVTGTKVRLSLNAVFTGSLISVRCMAPEGGLLETVAIAETGLSSAGSDTIQVAVYDWTPLEGGTRRLPEAVLEYAVSDGAESRLSSEPSSVFVREGTRKRASSGAAVPKALADAFSDAPSSPSAPDAKEGYLPVPPSLAAAVDDTVLLEAGRDWMEGKRGRALARLREAEYASLFPSRYRAARLEAEQSLGLDETTSVPASAWKHPSLIASIVLLAIALSPLFFRPGFRGPAAFLVCLSIALASFAVVLYVKDSRPAAVVVSGDLFHVPDSSSRVVESLAEGSVVGIYRSVDGWAYVRTERSLYGWMRDNQLIVYTRGDAKR